jgi:diguanylate cyclase (GGDEF)-like protein
MPNLEAAEPFPRVSPARVAPCAPAAVTTPAARDGGEPISVETLRANPFFAQFTEGMVTDLAPYCRLDVFAPGEGLIAGGQEGTDIFVIESGRASVVVPVEGSKQVVAEPARGALLGELAMIRGRAHGANVTAKTVVEAVRIPRAPFEEMLRSDPRWLSAFLAFLAERVQATTRPLARLSYAAEHLISDDLDAGVLEGLEQESEDLGRFAGLFREMAHYLTDRTQRLEAAVAERTRALTEEIARRSTAEAELKRLAATDSLTGAANRRHFQAEAARELARAKRYGRPLAVMMLDIDHFKKINDTYGHAAGDQVLRALVERCRANLRSQDVLGRLGGEEFAVLAPECPPERCMMLAERLRGALAGASVETDEGAVSFTVSIGVTDCPPESPIEDHLERADKALYQAKRGGRNRVVRA